MNGDPIDRTSKTVTRYTAMPFEDQHGNEWPANMEEMDDGDWVRWEDMLTWINSQAIHLSSGGRDLDAKIYTKRRDHAGCREAA